MPGRSSLPCPLQMPRKIDLQLESGEYFLTDTQKRQAKKEKVAVPPVRPGLPPCRAFSRPHPTGAGSTGKEGGGEANGAR